MSVYSISGNVVAHNARLCLRDIHETDAIPAVTYSDSSGNYTFSGVAVGTYQIIVDLSECIASPYNTGYSYRSPQGVRIIASNLTNVNFTPSHLNASS